MNDICIIINNIIRHKIKIFKSCHRKNNKTIKNTIEVYYKNANTNIIQAYTLIYSIWTNRL